jgi:hypothetical protein
MSLKPALIVSDLLALDQAEAGLLIACHLDQRGVVRAQVGAVERQVVPVVMGRVVVVLERAHHAAHSRLEGIHRVDAGVLARAADSEGPAVGKHVDLRGELRRVGLTCFQRVIERRFRQTILNLARGPDRDVSAPIGGTVLGSCVPRGRVGLGLGGFLLRR